VNVVTFFDNCLALFSESLKAEKEYALENGNELNVGDEACPYLLGVEGLTEVRNAMGAVRFHGLPSVFMPESQFGARHPDFSSDHLLVNERRCGGPGVLIGLQVDLGSGPVFLDVALTGHGQHSSIQTWNGFRFDELAGWVDRCHKEGLDLLPYGAFGRAGTTDNLRTPGEIAATTYGPAVYKFWLTLFGDSLATYVLLLGFGLLIEDAHNLIPTLNRSWYLLRDELELVPDDYI